MFYIFSPRRPVQAPDVHSELDDDSGVMEGAGHPEWTPAPVLHREDRPLPQLPSHCHPGD